MTKYCIVYQLGGVEEGTHRKLSAALRHRDRIAARLRRDGDCQGVKITAIDPDGERPLTDAELDQINDWEAMR